MSNNKVARINVDNILIYEKQDSFTFYFLIIGLPEIVIFLILNFEFCLQNDDMRGAIF